MSIEVEKTDFLTVNEKTIPVSQLPDQIREQVRIFDAIRQDLMDSTYKTNVYQLAAEHKKHQLEQLMQRYMEADEERKNSESGKADAEPAPRPQKASKKKASRKKSVESEDSAE